MKSNVKSYSTLLMCVLYMVSFFFQSVYVYVSLMFVTTVVFVMSVAGARTIPKLFSVVMMLVGMLLMVTTGKGITGIMDGITSNVPLITLLVLVPLISIPLKFGPYLENLLAFLQKSRNHPKRLFLQTTLFIFVLGPILSLGSIRLLHDLVKPMELSPKLLSKAYFVGFSSVILWSPYFASVALVLYYLHLPIIDYLPYSLPFAILQLFIGISFYMLYSSRHNELQINVTEKNDVPYSMKILLQVCVFVMLLMSLVLFLEYVSGWPMMLLVSITAVLFPTVVGLLLRKQTILVREFIRFKTNSVPAMSNEIVMFVSAGVFGKSLAGTSFSNEINDLLLTLSERSFVLFALFIIIVIATFTFFGLHPIVLVIPLLSQLDPYALSIAPERIALLFMIAWAVSAIISPVNPLNLLVSGLVNEKSLKVGLRWNGPYVLAMILVGLLYLSIFVV